MRRAWRMSVPAHIAISVNADTEAEARNRLSAALDFAVDGVPLNDDIDAEPRVYVADDKLTESEVIDILEYDDNEQDNES